jgi:prolyl-tRNA synthetase
VPIGYHKSEAVRTAANQMYDKLGELGIDVLLEDREERPGVLFADMDLIGIPHRVVIGERGLAAGTAEYKARRDEKASDVPLAEVVPLLQQKLA